MSSADEVLRDADLAMYSAKAKGKAGYQFFTPEMREHALERLALETELRSAPGDAHAQRAVSAYRGGKGRAAYRLRSAWRVGHTPSTGRCRPSSLSHWRKRQGLILELDLFVLREACAQVHAWQQSFPQLPPLTLSANPLGQELRAA